MLGERDYTVALSLYPQDEYSTIDVVWKHFTSHYRTKWFVKEKDQQIENKIAEPNNLSRDILKTLDKEINLTCVLFTRISPSSSNSELWDNFCWARRGKKK